MVTDPEIRYYSNGEDISEDTLNRPLTDIEQHLLNIYEITGLFTELDSGDADKYLRVNSDATGIIFDDISVDFVRTPDLVSPSDEATGVSLSPTLTASEYAPLYSVDSRDYREFQLIVDGGDFSTPELSTQTNSDSWSPDLSSYLDTSFAWRCRDVSLNGYTSDWSAVYTFTTGTAYVKTPSISVQQDGNFAFRSPVLTGSVFDVFGAQDGTHVSTDWRITRTSDSVVVWSSIGNTTDLETITVPDQTLDIETEYKFEVRYDSDIYGTSEWGSITRTTVDYFVKTPELSSDTSGVEGDDHIVNITNYDASLTYVITVSDGSASRSGSTITWSLPLVSQNTTHQINVYAVNQYAEQSSTASLNVTVLNIPTVSDDAVIISSFTQNVYNDGWSV